MLDCERQTKEEIALNLPSFSIVYETENLSSVELDNVYRSLASLATQDIPLEQANEFLVIDGGNAPAGVIADLCSKYPWITVERFPRISYYAAKMQGACLVTGEIVVYCDSDCIYVKNWLASILNAFASSSDVDVVAGETSTPIKNPYDLAIAMHYFFPRFSSKSQLYKSDNYYMNNVAFRRDFLLQNPLPNNLPLYRGSCTMHSYALSKLKGHQIWRNPQARTVHEPPALSFTFWRYLLMGHDQLKKEYIRSYLEEQRESTDCSKLLAELYPSLFRQKKFQILTSTILKSKPFKRQQIHTVLKEQPRRVLMFPIAIPLMVWFGLLHMIGIIVTFFQPELLYKLYYRLGDEPIRLVQEGERVM